MAEAAEVIRNQVLVEHRDAECSLEPAHQVEDTQRVQDPRFQKVVVLPDRAEPSRGEEGLDEV
jgi:quinolinate synthase